MQTAQATPLLSIHEELGARIVDFAGFRMPLQYTGVIDEHRTVREALGLFDVSHMGQVELTGPGAVDAANYLVTNNVAALSDGGIVYTPICYPDGGIVDDCLVYRLGDERVLIVVNASNIAKDHEWIVNQVGDRCTVTNRSNEFALIAIQGPCAIETAQAVADADIKSYAPFSCGWARLGGVESLVSRTGYTGEDGFEIACAPADAPLLWRQLSQAGAPRGLKPCGLGARDTLRLEARLCLYGNDIDATTTPLEAGLGWTVKMKSGDFVGRDALKQQKKQGIKRKLVSLKMRSRGIARHGHTLHLPGADGQPGESVGEVTSGTKSPTLGVAIALGYVSKDQTSPGTRLVVDVRGKPVEAEVVKGPFYKRAE